MAEAERAAVADRKPVGHMTKAELKDEIEQEYQQKPPPGATSVNQLREFVQSLRDHEAEREQQEDQDEPPPEFITDEEATERGLIQPQGTAAELDEAHTQALELREKAVPAQHAIPGAGEFNAIMAIADRLAHSRIVPVAYQGKPDNIVAAIMLGRELGIGPMQSLKSIHVIDDKPAPSAELLLAILRRGGVVVIDSGVNDERAYIRAKRLDSGEEMQVEWTYAEAQKIKDRKGKILTDKANWSNYRHDMLWARAVGRLARRLGPDKTAGMGYTSEEIQDFADDWGDEYSGGYGDNAPVYKQDAPEAKVPRNEAELFQRMSALLGADEAREWLREAVVKWADTQHRVTVSKYTELSTGLKAVVGQKLAGVVLDLEQRETETGEDLRMSTGVREKTARAFAARLDGLALDGPAWRLDPDETDRPEGSAPESPAPVEDPQPGSDDDPDTIDLVPIAEDDLDIPFPGGDPA